MSRTILVFAEQRGGTIKRSVLELIGLARDLSEGGAVEVALLGSGVAGLAQELSRYGARVHHADDPAFEHADAGAYVAQLHALAEKRTACGRSSSTSAWSCAT